MATATAFGAITGGTCAPSGVTNDEGRYTVTANSNATGVAQVTASGTVAFDGGVNVGVATNGYGAHDISNQKTWVRPDQDRRDRRQPG